MQVSFEKWHGLGNDYVLIEDALSIDPSQVAARMCDRRLGIGADGLLLLGEADEGLVSFRVFNADGTEAELCGNGLRCAAAYWCLRSGGTNVEMQSVVGRHVAEVRQRTDKSFDVNMTLVPVQVGDAVLLEWGNRHETVHVVHTGNPHAIILDASDAMIDQISEVASRVTEMECFREGVNVHLARADGAMRVHMWSWERGVGFVSACATGAAAVAKLVAGNATGSVCVVLPGGELLIEPGSSEVAAIMNGPASPICMGQWPVPSDLYPRSES
ncbi:MAG: diaminopimelate epimerase [Phycisphaerales bacterium]|nr:diaminopimelate epimerase [Phycisphaerales bacterium]